MKLTFLAISEGEWIGKIRKITDKSSTVQAPMRNTFRKDLL